MSTQLSFDLELELPQPEAVERVTEALMAQGFGVLTHIHIHKAFADKLDIQFRPYTILGACNPPLAYKALSSSAEAGLLLPCNVTIEESGRGTSIVRIVNPEVMMTVGGFGEHAEIAEVGKEAARRLRVAAQELAAG